MGHERVGALPRSKRWVEVVEEISSAATFEGDVDELSRLTIRNVRSRLERASRDKGVHSAFEFLLALSLAASKQIPFEGQERFDLDLTGNPSPLELTVSLNEWVDSNKESGEYAELARRAAANTIAVWTKSESQQLPLFGERKVAIEVWERASNGRGFCEVARLFFSNFVERYINYFIAREASVQLPSTLDRDRLHSRLRNHVDSVSQHAFETAQIAQSFAAGWFNRHTIQGMPPSAEIERFVAHSISKIREELLREGVGR